MMIARSFVASAAWALVAGALAALCAATAQAAEAPTITASVSDSTLPESVGTVKVRLTLEHPPEAIEDGEGYTGCRLRLGAGGVAASPADVTFSNQKKLNPGNGWSAEAGLMTVVDDALVEGNETLVVEGHCTGSKPGTEPSHEELASRPLTLTIVDDDEPGAIALSVSPTRIVENGGEQAVTVTAEAANAPDAAVTVSLTLGAGSYAVTGTRSIGIAGGATRGSTTLTFAPSDDGNASDDRVTIDGNASGYSVAGTSLTIEEPPAGPPPRIVASVASTVLLESAGRVDVRLMLEDPPATDDAGYTGCRLRLGAGGDAGTADVTFSNQKKLNAGNGWSAEAGLLTVVDDALVEGDESLVVEGHCTGSNSGTRPPHGDLRSAPLTLTIRDNDFPEMTLSLSPARIGEKDGAQAVTVTAATDHAPPSALIVDLDLGPGAYRVSAGNEEIEIAAHARSGSTTLTFVPRTDGNLSDDEVRIGGQASGYTVVGTVLTIVEPPPGPPPRIVASVGATTIAESAGRVNVRLTLEHPPEVIDDDVGYTGCRLRLGAGSEAAEPADVTFSNQKKLNGENGWTAEAGLLTVVDDTLVEGDETLVVEGYCTGDQRGPDPPYTELVSVPLTLTIQDDDEPTIALSVSPDRIGEDLGAQGVTVTASTRYAPDTALTVNLDLGAGAYRVSGTQAIEIGANATRGTTTLTFEPSDDGNDADDAVRIDGSASGYEVAGATLTIEEPAVRMTPRILASAREVLRESAGEVSVRLRLEHPPPDATAAAGYTGCRLRLGVGGDAETPGDATFSGQVDLTLANGWSAAADLLTVVDDTVQEEEETLIVEGYCAGSTSGLDPPHADLESVPLSLTIVDNDDPVMWLSVRPRNIREGAGEQTVTVSAETDAAPDSALTVNLILGAGAYDTTGLRFIEIGAGETSGSTELTFDPGHDGNRTADTVRIDGRAPGYVVHSTSLTINERLGQDLPVIVASVADTTLAESADGVNVRLTLDHPPETDGEGGYTGCRLRLGAGGEAEEPADVVFENQKKLNPSNGWSAEARLLWIVDDDTYEGDETLVVEGYCTGTNRGVAPSHAELDFVPLELTIADNDLPTISLTTNPKRIGEGGGAQAVTVTAWAEKAPERDGVMVHLDIEAGSYTVTGSRNIWIDRGERSNSRTLTFEPTDDGNATDDEIAIRGDAWGYRVEAALLTVQDSANGAVAPTALAPLFLNALDPFRQGFVRIVNRSGSAGEVRITAIDDTGWQPASLTIALAADSVVHLNSGDLENGNPDKGIADGVGRGTGRWRLLFDSDLDIRVLTYVRTRDGFLTAMHDVAPVEDGKHRVAIFNPGSNVDQVSTLRVVNLAAETAAVSVQGYDQGSINGRVVRFDVPANGVGEYTAAELESGAGVEGALGDGTGKWQLEVESEKSIVVMSLLRSPEGYLTNLSSIPVRPERGDVHPVPLFPAASDPLGRQGFVRLINLWRSKGDVTVRAYDRSGAGYPPLTIGLDAREVAHFNSDDLELGSASKGLTGSTGSGDGDWRLEVTGALDLDVLSYVRATGGFLTSMHDVVPSVQGVYNVATFNPASNRSQVSRLLTINPGNRDASVAIEGIDDTGASPGGTVEFTLAAGTVRTLDASELESGSDGLSGVIGDGTGKWRLTVEADRPILVVNLLATPTGHITNLSSVPD